MEGNCLIGLRVGPLRKAAIRATIVENLLLCTLADGAFIVEEFRLVTKRLVTLISANVGRSNFLRKFWGAKRKCWKPILIVPSRVKSVLATMAGRTVFPWFVGVMDDHETLDMAESDTWSDLSDAHRDHAPSKRTVSGFRNAHLGDVLYAFPAVASLSGNFGQEIDQAIY